MRKRDREWIEEAERELSHDPLDTNEYWSHELIKHLLRLVKRLDEKSQKPPKRKAPEQTISGQHEGSQ